MRISKRATGSPITVSQLNFYVKSVFEENALLSDVYLKGELSNISINARSGHMYFSVKDEAASIKAVMFAGYLNALEYLPENGMDVLVRGEVTLYERDGSYQINCFDILPQGIGLEQLKLEALKTKLAEEGLFAPERKRALPSFPGSVAVVTSASGAALQDVINVVSRRYPLCTLKVLPVMVQGANAPETIVKAIEHINRNVMADVAVLCRGGGSREDLAAFNNENVVRAVAGCKIPIISAVGHETDTTLSDYAADMRAPTPSAAAELAVPDVLDMLEYILSLKNTAQFYTEQKMDESVLNTKYLKGLLAAKNPAENLNRNRQNIENMLKLMNNNTINILEGKTAQYKILLEKLCALNPLGTLARGYGITLKNKNVVTDVEQLEIGDIVLTKLKNGQFESEILKIYQE